MVGSLLTPNIRDSTITCYISYLNIHLNPVLVHRDDPLHGRGVGEGEQECLSEDFMDKVDIVTGSIEYFPDQLSLHVKISHVVALVQ